MTDEQVKDYTLRIAQANSSALAVIECELIEDCLKEAERQAGAKDWAAFCHQIRKAERYLGELIHSFNYREEAGRVLGDYCVQAHRSLVRARIGKNVDALSAARRAFVPVLPVLQRIADNDAEPPVMEHTQKVYAGLTYGRASLNETAVDISRNRGYTV